MDAKRPNNRHVDERHIEVLIYRLTHIFLIKVIEAAYGIQAQVTV